MGNFLAISSIIGKTKNEVITSLTNYAISVNGGLQEESNIDSSTDNCCIIDEENGNVSVFYPNGYLEWDDSSAYLSKELNATVFSFHIHDGDFWMYVLYNNGQIIDQFNPIQIIGMKPFRMKKWKVGKECQYSCSIFKECNPKRH
jgi:hypothetical protein